MSWSKYTVEDSRIPGISIFAILLIIVSLYVQSKLVLFLGCFFLIIVGLNQLYLMKTGMELFLDNKPRKNHYFRNEQGKWTLIFRNDGYPILKGELRVCFDEYVSPIDGTYNPSNSLYEIIIPFSLLTNQTRKIEIPYKTVKRGIAKIRRLEMHIPSLIGFGTSVLEYKNIMKQEAVVYPIRMPVKGLKEQLSVLQGGSAVTLSVYEDLLGPLGTRDYVSTDTFNRINWKASAKKQNLQTKIFEKISEKGWNVSLNVADGYAVTNQIEQIISCTTEFAYYALRNQIPYSVCINVRTAGSTPFYYIAKGEGKEHLQKVLELLSSVNNHNTIFPYEKMISIYKKHLGPQPYFLHAGNRTRDVDIVLQQIGSQGVVLTELNICADYGHLKGLEERHQRRRQV